MITTTLNKIKAAHPRTNEWRKLLSFLGKREADDEPLPFATIVESNGLYYALWATRTMPEHDKDWRLFAVWCARQVQHLMTDERSLYALDVAEQYAHGLVSDKEMDAAWAAALAAARDAANYAARAVGRATASDAAWAAAIDAQLKEFLRVVS